MSQHAKLQMCEGAASKEMNGTGFYGCATLRKAALFLMGLPMMYLEETAMRPHVCVSPSESSALNRQSRLPDRPQSQRVKSEMFFHDTLMECGI